MQLSVVGEEASPSASSLGLTITGRVTGGGPLTKHKLQLTEEIQRIEKELSSLGLGEVEVKIEI